jgi:NADPH-dependent ferric siderophore reductase
MATATTTVTIERSGPAIRAALAKYAPEDEPRFTAEMRSALDRAGDDLDLAGPQAVLARWHALATMAANPLTADEHAQLQRAKAGDLTGLSERDEHGNWTTL